MDGEKFQTEIWKTEFKYPWDSSTSGYLGLLVRFLVVSAHTISRHGLYFLDFWIWFESHPVFFCFLGLAYPRVHK